MSIKPFAFNILTNRHITIAQLTEKGITVNDSHTNSIEEAKEVIDYSKFAILFYSIGVILLILHFVFKNNKLPEVASASIDLSFIAIFIYLLYFVVTYFKSTLFYKHIVPKAKSINIILMLIGLPFYAITHFLLKNKIKEDLDKSCLENVK